MRITGQLPVADAALLSAQLDALMPPATAYAHTGEAPTRDARRADALVLLTQHAAGGGTLPSHGVDRPQIHLTLDYDTLVTGLGEVTLHHIVPWWQDGATCLANGVLLCPFHHRLEPEPLQSEESQWLVHPRGEVSTRARVADAPRGPAQPADQRLSPGCIIAPGEPVGRGAPPTASKPPTTGSRTLPPSPGRRDMSAEPAPGTRPRNPWYPWGRARSVHAAVGPAPVALALSPQPSVR